jgi:phosphomevalonate kinase
VRIIAPGKLLLTGAYAVLEGAPAIVAAIDRHAVVDVSPTDTRLREDGHRPPRADVHALHDETGRKLGLGSSAAACVASFGAEALASGDDLRSPIVRARIFRAAREAHARAQGGGSGVDVAASVHGGVLRYAVGANGDATLRALDLPRGLHLTVYDSGTSARTSDMRARVNAFRTRPSANGLFKQLGDLSIRAAAAIEAGDGLSFIASAREFGDVLAVLGHAADAPIVLPPFAELASVAAREDAAFLPSGAGGGDVAVRLGMAPPSPAFASLAKALSMFTLALSIDREGLRSESPS